MRALFVLLLSLGMVLPVSVAEASRTYDPTAGDPKGVRETAAHVAAAHRSGRDARIRRLALRPEPDPWKVSDLLCALGEGEAATDFARHVKGRAATGLVHYVEARVKSTEAPPVRELGESVNEAARAEDWAAVLRLTEDLPDEFETVGWMQVADARASALAEVGRNAESAELYRTISAAAERVGWITEARYAQYHSSVRAHASGRVQEAAAGFRRAYSLADSVRDRAAMRKSLYAMAIMARAAGDFRLMEASALRAYELALLLRAKKEAMLSLTLIAGARLELGRSREAIPFIDAAILLAEELEDRVAVYSLLSYLGLAYYQSSEHAQARPLMVRGLAEAEARGDTHGVLVYLGNLGGIDHGLGDNASAVAFYERKLALAEQVGNLPAKADALHNLGVIRSGMREYAAARAHLEQALPILEQIGEASRLVPTLRQLGEVAVSQGRRDEARAYLERALDVLERLQAPAELAKVLMGLGDLEYAVGNTKRARALYERSLAVSEALDDPALVANALLSLGDAHSQAADFERARACFGRALRIYESLGWGRKLGTVLCRMGEALHRSGDTAGARRCHEQELALARRLGDERDVAAALINLSIVHASTGDVRRSIALLGRAQAIAERHGDAELSFTALLALGDGLRALGEYPRALAAFERAQELTVVLRNPAEEITALANHASIQKALGQYDGALEKYVRALEIARRIGNPVLATAILNSLGATQALMGDHDEALETFQDALDLARRMGYQSDELKALTGMGAILQTRREFEEAQQLFEDALSRAEHWKSRSPTIALRADLGGVLVEQGECDRGIRHIEEAMRLARRRGDPAVLVEVRGALAHAQLRSRDPKAALATAMAGLEALEDLAGGLAEEEGASLKGRFQPVLEAGTLAGTALGQSADVLTFLESGRAGSLLESLEAGVALRLADLPEALAQAEIDAKAGVTQARRAHARTLARGVDAEVQAARESLDEAVEKRRQLAARIQREVKRVAGLFYPTPATLEEIQALLTEGQVLVLYGLCSETTIALVLRHDSDDLVVLGDTEPIVDACAKLRSVQGRPGARGPLAREEGAPDSEDMGEPLERLRRLLVDPLELTDADRTVLVSPEGPINYVPLAALLGDRNVAFTPSGTTHVLLVDDHVATGQDVLALGDPTYGTKVDAGAAEVYRGGAKLAALPATRDEALAVGDVTLLGDDANEAALREAIAKQDRWRSVHLACHGLVDPDRPTLSSLALTRAGEEDGFLTALEVLRMEIPADLAVLSACETAKGKVVKGEGIVGLTRAFMYAGAPRVLCSLWKVDDDATRALMEKFYELWNPKEEEGMPASEALRKAQGYVRSHEKWAHPYYWAAWVLWGLP